MRPRPCQRSELTRAVHPIGAGIVIPDPTGSCGSERDYESIGRLLRHVDDDTGEARLLPQWPQRSPAVLVHADRVGKGHR